MTYVRALLAALVFFSTPALAQWQVQNHGVPVGKGGGSTGFSFAAPTNPGSAFVGNGLSSDPTFTLNPTWLGTHTWAPPANTTTQGLLLNQTLPVGSAGLNNPYSANLFSIVNNGYQTPPGGATDSFGDLPVVSGFRVNYSSAGSGAGQFPVHVGALFATKATSRGQQLVGLNGTVYSNINSAGEDAFWGGISLANAGPSSNIKALWGHDAEVGAETGAVVPVRVGVGATSVGPVTGSSVDAAFAATACCANVGVAAPWVNALALYKSDTMAPVSGSIIVASAPFTMQYGLKLDNVTFANKIFDFGASILQVDGVGNATFGGVGNFAGPVSATRNANSALTFQAINTSTGTGATASFTSTNNLDQSAFGLAGSGYTTVSQLANRAYVHSGPANNGIIFDAGGAKPIDFYINNARVGGFTGAGALTLTTPLAAGSGGTGLSALGTGIAAALGTNVGSAGAPVLFNGAGGTPSSITLTNGTGLPTTGLTGTLQAAQEPAHTGGCTNSAGSLALSCVNNTSIIGGGATNTILAGATGWVGVGLICNATEAFCYLPQPQAGTVSNIYVNVNNAPGAGQTYTVTMRKNATNQTVTCTISGAAATSCNDTTHSFAVAAADNVSVQITSSGAAATLSVANFGFKLATTSP